jgi:hypothetical protein
MEQSKSYTVLPTASFGSDYAGTAIEALFPHTAPPLYFLVAKRKAARRASESNDEAVH